MIGILWILIGVIILGYYNGLLILDGNIPESDPKYLTIKDDWHIVGSILFIYISLTAWYIWGADYVPLSLSLFWSLFAGIVNMVGLNKGFFFVGTTAKTDVLLRKLFPKNPEIGSAILKSIVLVLSILLIFIYK